MRIIEHNLDLDEELAVRLLGWKWMSFLGRPMSGCPGYPDKVRVRQLLSAKQLKSQEWIGFLAQRDGREATGDEPLAYTYCSGVCNAASIPAFTILVDE